MGYILDVDLETTYGATDRLYIRIESIVLNRVSGKIRYQVTYWIDQDHCIASTKKYTNEDEYTYEGLVGERMIYYTQDVPDGYDIILPHMVEEDLAEIREVEVPVFETIETSKEVPNISFDRDGNEITVYKTITTTEKIKTGTKTELRKVIIPELANDIYALGYKCIFRMLKQYFPKDKIIRN